MKPQYCIDKTEVEKTLVDHFSARRFEPRRATLKETNISLARNNLFQKLKILLASLFRESNCKFLYMYEWRTLKHIYIYIYIYIYDVPIYLNLTKRSDAISEIQYGVCIDGRQRCTIFLSSLMFLNAHQKNHKRPVPACRRN